MTTIPSGEEGSKLEKVITQRHRATKDDYRNEIGEIVGAAEIVTYRVILAQDFS